MKTFFCHPGAIAGLCLSTLLTGCMMPIRSEEPKVVALRWDALVARGARPASEAQPVKYSQLDIDLEKLGTPLRLQMPEGNTMDTSAAPEAFWPYTMYAHRVKQFPEKFRRGNQFLNIIFPGGLHGTIGGYSLELQDGRIVGLGVTAMRPATPDIHCPAVGIPSKAGTAVLPLTEGELVALFGPYRDKIFGRGFHTSVPPP